MKITLLVTYFFYFLVSTLAAQVRYTGEELRDYYYWFHQYSQTALFYEDGARLVSFTEKTPVRQYPNVQAAVAGYLGLGEVVTNQLIPVARAVVSTEKGYQDQWFKVTACQATTGQTYTGYVWGGHLAKSWLYYDLDQDGTTELVALGLHLEQRRAPEDIQADLKVIHQGQLQASLAIAGLCLFDDCGSSNLLRVYEISTQPRQVIFETSTLTAGCLVGVDKAFVSWDTNQLRLIYQAEYSTGHQYANNAFYRHQDNATLICYYQNENNAFEPVWACKPLSTTVAVP
ncbi:MAG: hypothetical protein DA408_00695 [Bacteroidetes bacterium]|nr:MAG: hypothetical protein DA408_00695 [Bacteroidota bacterium]